MTGRPNDALISQEEQPWLHPWRVERRIRQGWTVASRHGTLHLAPKPGSDNDRLPQRTLCNRSLDTFDWRFFIDPKRCSDCIRRSGVDGW